MSQSWYIEYKGKVVGPATSSQLKQLAQTGKITRDTPVRLDQGGKWVRAGNIQGLFSTTEAQVIKKEDVSVQKPMLKHAVPHIQPESTSLISNSETSQSQVLPPKHKSAGQTFPSTIQFDSHQTISAWVAGAGLLILGLSPFFKWIQLGGGGVTGLAGDGKVVLVATVIAAAVFTAAVVKQKWLSPVVLCVQAWGTIAMFWMGALIWKVGSILDSPDAKDNPLAAMFSTMLVSPGPGLYLGLIGGITVTAALGFLAVRILVTVGNLKLFVATQSISCILGILLAFFVGPDRPGQSGTAESPTNILSGLPPVGASSPPNAGPKIEGIELAPTLAAKRFAASNIEEGEFEEFIWLDIDWTVKKVKKPVRAVKGTLHLMDIFGESKMTIEWTIEQPLNSGDRFAETGVGFEYNKFRDSHAWVRSATKENMTLNFVPKSVIYSDGSRESL